MNTIYVLIRKGELIEVAPSFNPDDALKHCMWAVQGTGGEMYAVRCSDAVATAIRDATINPPPASKPSALKLAKMFAYSLTKCADLT